MKQIIGVILIATFTFVCGILFHSKISPIQPVDPTWKPLNNESKGLIERHFSNISKPMAPTPLLNKGDDNPRRGYVYQWQENSIGELWYRRVGKPNIQIEFK